MVRRLVGIAVLGILALGRSFAADQAPLALSIAGDVLHANTLEFGQFALRDVVATPRYQGRDLRFHDATASAYGGTVTGDLTIHFPAPGDDATVYDGTLAVANGDLGMLLRQFGGNTDNLSGIVHGWVRFRVPAGRLDQMSGEGAVTVEKATLVQLSLLTTLLAGDPTADRGKDRLDVRFRIADGRLHLSNTRLTSPSARVAISGSIGLDGSLRLALVPSLAFRLVDGIPGLGTVVAPALTSLGTRMARLLVRGQITDPVLVPDPFTSSRD
jgi:hypothetical protein